MFSLRIVKVDHYLAPPVHPLDPTVSVFRGCEVWQVPVLRVFGVTHAGQKACLHVHGVFPYLCVPYDDEDEGCEQPGGKFSQTLALELDRLLNVAAGKSNSSMQHVYNIEAIRAIPLYGFYAKERSYLRISFYNPFTVRKAAELLLSGMVLNHIMQPHEAHIPYVLQFLIDQNLHGMNMLHVEKFKFRQMSLNFEAAFQRDFSLRPEATVWILRDLPPASFLDSKVEKQTICELELDCCVRDILNVKDHSDGMNPGLSAIWEDERERKRERGETSSLCMPPSLDRDDVVRSESEMFYLRRLDKQLQAARPPSSRSQINQPDLPTQEPTASAYSQGPANSNPDLSVSASLMLDTQDMSLVEMLARATANQSMTEDPSEDVDSILSLLPASQAQQEDSEAEDEDDATTREMSQVFNSEHHGDAETEADGRASASQECLHSALSDWDDQDDIQRLPSQLDGTDDSPSSLRPETGYNKSPHQPSRTESKANDVMSSCSSPSETPLVTDDEKEVADEVGSCWEPLPPLMPELLSSSGRCEPRHQPPLAEIRATDVTSSCSSPSETPLVTDDEKDDELGSSWKPPPLLSRRLLPCGGGTLIGDDSESSCTDVEMNKPNYDQESAVARPEELRTASASFQLQCRKPRPARKHKSMKLSLTLCRENATAGNSSCSEVAVNLRSSPRKPSAAENDCATSSSPRSAGSKDHALLGCSVQSLQAPSTEGNDRNEHASLKVSSVFPKKLQVNEDSEKAENTSRGSKRTASDVCDNTNFDTLVPEQVKRKKREAEQSSKAHPGKKCKNMRVLKKCCIIVSRLSNECIRAWTENVKAGYGEKPCPAKRSKDSTCRSGSTSESLGKAKAPDSATVRINTLPCSKPNASPNLQRLLGENEGSHDSDLDSIDLPKVVIDVASETELEPPQCTKNEKTDIDVSGGMPTRNGKAHSEVVSAGCSLEICKETVHRCGTGLKRVSSTESSTETIPSGAEKKRVPKANALDHPFSEGPAVRHTTARTRVTNNAFTDDSMAHVTGSGEVNTGKRTGASIENSKEAERETKVGLRRKVQNVKERKDTGRAGVEMRECKHDVHDHSTVKEYEKLGRKKGTRNEVNAVKLNRHKEKEKTNSQKPKQHQARAAPRNKICSTDSCKDITGTEESSGTLKESVKRRGRKKIGGGRRRLYRSAGMARKESLSSPGVCSSTDFGTPKGTDKGAHDEDVSFVLSHSNSCLASTGKHCSGLKNGRVLSPVVSSPGACAMDNRIWNLEYLPAKQDSPSVALSSVSLCAGHKRRHLTVEEEAAAIVQSSGSEVQDKGMGDSSRCDSFSSLNKGDCSTTPFSSNEKPSHNSSCLSGTGTQISESRSSGTSSNRVSRRHNMKRRRMKSHTGNGSSAIKTASKSLESNLSQSAPTSDADVPPRSGSGCVESIASSHSENSGRNIDLSGVQQLNQSVEQLSLPLHRNQTDVASSGSVVHHYHASDASSRSSDQLVLSGSTLSKTDIQSLVSLYAASNSVAEEEFGSISNGSSESQTARGCSRADIVLQQQLETNQNRCSEAKGASNEEYLLNDDFLDFDSEQHWVIVDEVGEGEVGANNPTSPELFSSQGEISCTLAERGPGAISTSPVDNLSKVPDNVDRNSPSASLEVEHGGQSCSEQSTKSTDVKQCRWCADSPCAKEAVEGRSAVENSETENEVLSLDFLTGSQEDRVLVDALVALESKLRVGDQDIRDKLGEGEGEGVHCCHALLKDNRNMQGDSGSFEFLNQELQSRSETGTEEDSHQKAALSPPGSIGFECLLSDGLDSGDEIQRFYHNRQLELIKNEQEDSPTSTGACTSPSKVEEAQCGHYSVAVGTVEQLQEPGYCKYPEEKEATPAVFCLEPTPSDLLNDVLGSIPSASAPPSEDVRSSMPCAERMEETLLEQDISIAAVCDSQNANDQTLEAPHDEAAPLNCSSSFDSTLQAGHSQNETGVHSFYIDASIVGDNVTANSSQCSKLWKNDIPFPLGRDGLVVMTPLIRPPSYEEVDSSLETYGLPSCIPLQPFCSRPSDGPLKSFLPHDEADVDPLEVFNCRRKGMLRSDLPGWQQQIAEEYAEIKKFPVDFMKNPEVKIAFCSIRAIVLTPVILPPSEEVVTQWIAERKKASSAKENDVKGTCGKGTEACWDSDSSRLPSQNSVVGDAVIIKQSTPFTHTKSASRESALGKKLHTWQDVTSAQRKDPCVGNDASPGGSSLVCDLSPVSPLTDTRNSRLEKGINPQAASPLSSKMAAITRKRLLDSGFKKCSSFNTSSSQLDGPTRSGIFNFKLTGDMRKAKDAHQMLTVMSAEVHVRTRGDLRPDPNHDPVLCIFYCLYNDVPDSLVSDDSVKEVAGAIVVGPTILRVPSDKEVEGKKAGLVRDMEDLLKSPDFSSSAPSEDDSSALGDSSPHESSSRRRRCKGNLFHRSGVTSLEALEYVASERELIDALVRLVRKWDPDILVGFEIQMLSWGYLLQRASCLGADLHVGLSRAPMGPGASHIPSSQDGGEADASHASDVTITGRVVLNIWRIMRKELTLNIYTFENIYFHVMHQRIPLFAFKTLTEWFDHETDLYRWRVVEHYVIRACGSVKLLNRLDIIGKTSEMARIFGIQFFEVLSRGSQFRVESMMLRSSRQHGMMAVSPSVQQRARMRAPEWIPLVMEPLSRLYTSPVVVLDFQSLYPSIMIAYNYCFSTCLGRVDCLGSDEPFVFGCTSLSVGTSLLNIVRKYVTVSPAGVAFVLPPVRKGVLPRMLEEILSTRIMVKQAMKECKQNKALTRVLDARQMGLKLIANVTYGYTAASYSGRMPCVEVADSIVSKGRETLERAIRTVEGTPRWGAKVIYGDTDSIFVLLEGKTKRQAFEIGHEIAEVVTAQNPKPVKLKFEKVYLPCVLQTKKRYVGFAYESQDQLEPVYDAKGIETVRRDGCPAVAKILEKSLRILFQSRDVSAVKHYVKSQFAKILSDKVNIQDFIFAKEYRGIAGYKPGACVPALEIARRLLQKDPRVEPRVGERVPYVVVYGSPGMRLIQLVRHVHEVLADPSARLNTHYYITRVIAPALNRIFNLLGTNVLKWYSDLPRPVQSPAAGTAGAKGSICRYLVLQVCPACRRPTERGEALCSSCREHPQYPSVVLGNKARKAQRAQNDIQKICRSCMGFTDKNVCISLDCPVLYRALRADRDKQSSLSWNDITAMLHRGGRTKV